MCKQNKSMRKRSKKTNLYIHIEQPVQPNIIELIITSQIAQMVILSGLDQSQLIFQIWKTKLKYQRAEKTFSTSLKVYLEAFSQLTLEKSNSDWIQAF